MVQSGAGVKKGVVKFSKCPDCKGHPCGIGWICMTCLDAYKRQVSDKFQELCGEHDGDRKELARLRGQLSTTNEILNEANDEIPRLRRRVEDLTRAVRERDRLGEDTRLKLQVAEAQVEMNKQHNSLKIQEDLKKEIAAQKVEAQLQRDRADSQAADCRQARKEAKDARDDLERYRATLRYSREKGSSLSTQNDRWRIAYNASREETAEQERLRQETVEQLRQVEHQRQLGIDKVKECMAEISRQNSVVRELEMALERAATLEEKQRKRETDLKTLNWQFGQQLDAIKEQLRHHHRTSKASSAHYNMSIRGSSRGTSRATSRRTSVAGSVSGLSASGSRTPRTLRSQDEDFMSTSGSISPPLSTTNSVQAHTHSNSVSHHEAPAPGTAASSARGSIDAPRGDNRGVAQNDKDKGDKESNHDGVEGGELNDQAPHAVAFKPVDPPPLPLGGIPQDSLEVAVDKTSVASGDVGDGGKGDPLDTIAPDLREPPLTKLQTAAGRQRSSSGSSTALLSSEKGTAYSQARHARPASAGGGGRVPKVQASRST